KGPRFNAAKANRRVADREPDDGRGRLPVPGRSPARNRHPEGGDAIESEQPPAWETGRVINTAGEFSGELNEKLGDMEGPAADRSKRPTKRRDEPAYRHDAESGSERDGNQRPGERREQDSRGGHDVKVIGH